MAKTIVLISAILGLSFIMWRVVNAAELDRPYSLYLFINPPVEDRPNIIRIGVGYPNKDACEKVKRNMRRVAGTLQCHP